MKCVDCGAEAEYQYNGNSYCEIHHRQHKQSDNSMWKEISEIFKNGVKSIPTPVRYYGKMLKEKREEKREWQKKIKGAKKKKQWWEQDLR